MPFINLFQDKTPVKNWYEIIGEQTITDAILDQLVHQSVRVELKGDSLRKSKKEIED